MAIDYQKEGKVAIFTINRPDALNSINIQAAREMNEAMADFRDDDGLWVGIITGAGTGHSALAPISKTCCPS